MRKPIVGLAVMLLTAGCFEASSSSSPTTVVVELDQVTTTTEAETTTTTTTTTTTPTTTTPPAAFQPRQTTAEERQSYILTAILFLSSTPYSVDNGFETSEWNDMLFASALVACQALYEGLPASSAMGFGLQQTPAKNMNDDELGSDEQTLAQTFMFGTKTFCPELYPYPSDTSRAALQMVNDWAELTGGDGIDEDTVIFDGTWVVGEDVQPGTYRDGGGSSGCYWERLSGFSGEMSDVIANGFSEDVQIVTIAPTDVGFHSSGCGIWTQQD